MRFRTRVVLLIVLSLAIAQALTAALLYGTARSNLIEQGKEQLARSTKIFLRQLDTMSEQAADAVEVLALDYPLREAIAQGDRETILSALRNHGARVRASRMFVISLDGMITVDTANPEATGMIFADTDLLDAATEGRVTALEVLDGVICSVVVAPVRAPLPISYIGACLPVDSARLALLSSLSAMPATITLTSESEGGTLIVTAATTSRPAVPSRTMGGALNEAAVIEIDGSEYLSVTTLLGTTTESGQIRATLDYPLEDALNQYRDFVAPMVLVLALTLLASIGGAVFIARSVSRPVEVLARAATRIGQGEDVPASELPAHSEIGQMSDALTHMAKAIRAREADLRVAISNMEIARDAAVTADEAKSQFLANMSHELRTPLNAVIGFAEIMDQQMLGPMGNGQYVEYAGLIHDSGDRLLVLVEEMLDLAKVEADTFELKRQTVDPGRLLRDSVEGLVPQSEEAGVTVKVECDIDAWPSIDGDAKRLSEMFAHIIGNALKFSPSGSSVAITDDVSATSLSISVRDEGVGIGKDHIARVAEPFYRVDSAYDGQHQGAGIGLSLAKTIAELHGGSLEIESVSDIGTTITISLPIIPRAANDQPHPKERQNA